MVATGDIIINVTGNVQQLVIDLNQVAVAVQNLGKATKSAGSKVKTATPSLAMDHLKGLSGTLRGIGTRLSWFGFRLSMMGRTLTRYMTKPLRTAIGLFQSWEKTLEELGFTLGFLAASGMLTNDLLQSLQDNMAGLADMGMKVKTIFGLMHNLFLTIGIDILSVLYESIMELIGALDLLWRENWEKLKPSFEAIADVIQNKVIPWIEEIGGPVLEGFASGLQTGITWIGNFLDSMDAERVKELAYFAGLLLALSPILTVLGLILFFVSIPLQVFGTLIGLLSRAAGITKASITALGKVLGGVFSWWTLVAAAAILTLILHWGSFVDIYNQYLKPALTWLVGSFQRLSEAIGLQIPLIDLLTIATKPIADAWASAARFLAIVINLMAAFMDICTEFINISKGISSNPLIKGIFGLFGIDLKDSAEAMKNSKQSSESYRETTQALTDEILGSQDPFSQLVDDLVNSEGVTGILDATMNTLTGTLSGVIATNFDNLFTNIDDLTFKFLELESAADDAARAAADLADQDYPDTMEQLRQNIPDPYNWLAELETATSEVSSETNVEVNIEVENLSSDIDIDDMVREISFKLAEEIR